MIIIADDLKRVWCRDSRWRTWTHVGSVKECIRPYRRMTGAIRVAKRINGRVIALPDAATLSPQHDVNIEVEVPDKPGFTRTVTVDLFSYEIWPRTGDMHMAKTETPPEPMDLRLPGNSQDYIDCLKEFGVEIDPANRLKALLPIHRLVEKLLPERKTLLNLRLWLKEERDRRAAADLRVDLMRNVMERILVEEPKKADIKKWLEDVLKRTDYSTETADRILDDEADVDKMLVHGG